MAKRYPLKPLRNFDYKLVEEKLEGVLINVDRDLQRRERAAEKANIATRARCLTLLNVMVRFSRNSYHALKYLVADTPEDPNRKPTYALIIAPVNRQLLDLLFSLVFMLDDFETRSLEYQRAGWREAREDYQKYKTEFSADPNWEPFLVHYKQGLERMQGWFGITEKERKNPKSIPFWKQPFELKDKQTRSRPFLRWLEKWLYGDTSAQAHLTFGGLFTVAPIIMAELAGGQDQEIVNDRMIPQYRFHQFSRTALVTLAVVTEIDSFCHLGNHDAISYLLTLYVEHVPEGKEMYKVRYEAMLRSRPAA
jgi:hypothetical protein